MKFLRRRKVSTKNRPERDLRLATRTRAVSKDSYQTTDRIRAMLKMSSGDVKTGRYRSMLYRFLCDNIPVVNSVIWTWSRLAAAPGVFKVVENGQGADSASAQQRLDDLARRIYVDPSGQTSGTPAFLVDMFRCLFRDGVFGGFVTVQPDGSGVHRFIPVDSIDIAVDESRGRPRLILESDDKQIDLSRPDFRHLAFNPGISKPLGQSILHAIPFVSYIEQQLIDDMRRSSHNAGFHRLHVKITPPERMSGESDSAFTDRINSYFDSTVSMIRSCEIDDNPVTWDNVGIEYIGPQPGGRSGNNQWFFQHRAIIEEVCAGTHLAPFLLGYSYGDTTSWSAFKFDVVMRQVRSVQAEATQLLEWIGNIDLALSGLNAECRFVFDNNFSYQATELASVRATEVDSLLKAYQAGLIDEASARTKVGDLL
ncbi:MAG: hypothetical protein OEV49_07565 [candidate division Zixibacteria bacterium]|nr:hypothetical protein [candidate division Zixibacteria bacterium]MDH3936075.1 hypothetical protein [candidate division Zixibacteria bacterium]MDH4032221.1 hypothetical protein [candidate division Zixibacteria bacterium]